MRGRRFGSRAPVARAAPRAGPKLAAGHRNFGKKWAGILGPENGPGAHFPVRRTGIWPRNPGPFFGQILAPRGARKRDLGGHFLPPLGGPGCEMSAPNRRRHDCVADPASRRAASHREEVNRAGSRGHAEVAARGYGGVSPRGAPGPLVGAGLRCPYLLHPRAAGRRPPNAPPLRNFCRCPRRPRRAPRRQAVLRQRPPLPPAARCSWEAGSTTH